jgi:hypothetical protein
MGEQDTGAQSGLSKGYGNGKGELMEVRGMGVGLKTGRVCYKWEEVPWYD